MLILTRYQSRLSCDPQQQVLQMNQLLEKKNTNHIHVHMTSPSKNVLSTHDKPIKKPCYNVTSGTRNGRILLGPKERTPFSSSNREKTRYLTLPFLSIVPAASSAGVFCCGAGVGGGVSSGGLGWLSVKGNSTVTSLSEKKVSLTNCQKRTSDQRNAREERLIKALTKRLINKPSEKKVWWTYFPKRTSG